MNQEEFVKGAAEECHAVAVGPSVVRIESVAEGDVLVSAGSDSPVKARMLASVDRSQLSVGREVLVSFEKGDLMRPIIIGVMENLLDDLVEMEMNSPVDVQSPKEVRVDGDKRVVIEADEVIVLKCGKSSITLMKNGKIIIKGAELLSRASGTNRIKGGSVGIN